MSSSNRTTAKGGKGTKGDKTHKTEKSDSGKGTTEKYVLRNNSEDPRIRETVKQLMEMSQRSEEEVCLALHESDYDLNQASNMLLENETCGEWETRCKKKKNRQLSTSKQEKTDENATAEEWNDNPQSAIGSNDKEKTRNKGSGPPRLHGRHNDSRGWRGREKQENERNLENGGGGRGDYQRGDRRGRSSGSTRGGGGSRGRGGGRAGGRYPPRGNRAGGIYNKPIDTWDNSNTWDNSTAAEANHNPAGDNWDDFPGPDEWSTEEYTGSLADTKVFTPSVPPNMDSIAEQSVQQSIDTLNSSQQMGHTLQINQQSVQIPSQSPVPMVGTLNAAQTQYLNQLTQQNSENLNKQYGSSQAYQNTPYDKSSASQVYGGGSNLQYSNTQQYGSTPVNYVNNNYDTNSYGTSQEQTSQPPQRTKTQRARVPPPSKIPSSAVEMPGDLNSSIGYLDVQFGAMDLIDSTAFDSSENKYGGNTTATNLDSNTPVPAVNNLDLNSTNVQNSSMDNYSTKINSQNSISSPLTQSLTSTDAIPQTTEHLTGVYGSSSAGARSSTQTNAGAHSAPAGLDITKSSDNQSYSQTSSYNSYQPKTNTYNSTTYSAPQTTNSYVSNQANSYVNNQSATYNSSSGNSYPNSYSSTTSYQSNANSSAFSITQANSYPSNNQNYPQNTSQSVYSGNTGLSNPNFGSTSTSQYNNYNSTNSHKLAKETTYDNSSNVASSTQTTTANSSVTSSASLTIAQTTLSSSKTTTTLAKNSNSVVTNIPPGVAPVMSTPYIMGQVPYFQQPITYSYEDMQLLQQRMPPHMTTPYYDMSYQTPTTLAAVRDGTLSNVGYSISDGRFTRGDNNASPVPSTLSQQTSTLTQGHQAPPILTGTAPPYFFATPFNTIPNYQFGTMYTQLPAATNAHGTSNSNQYPKPATYGSGYGAYDALSQTQDYTKGGYVGNTQGQKGSGGNASSTVSTGNDLSAMYAKTHTALGKVNSYEKGFHSGTPPPFTGPLHGNQNAGLTPTGTGYAPQVYIPTMPHQQHHSTPMMHQPLHQMDVRHQGRRADSGNSSGQRSQASNQAKTGAKQSYPTSYWNQS